MSEDRLRSPDLKESKQAMWMEPRNAVDSAEARQKLRSAIWNDPASSFFAMLADRLPGRVDPLNFCLAARILLMDLKSGKNGFTGQEMTGKCAGLDPSDYEALSQLVPSAARHCFDPAFADQVAEEWKLASQPLYNP